MDRLQLVGKHNKTPARPAGPGHVGSMPFSSLHTSQCSRGGCSIDTPCPQPEGSCGSPGWDLSEPVFHRVVNAVWMKAPRLPAPPGTRNRPASPQAELQQCEVLRGLERVCESVNTSTPLPSSLDRAVSMITETCTGRTTSAGRTDSVSHGPL